MTLTLFRREPAVRSLMWWLPIAAVVGAWLWGMCRHSGATLGPVPYRDHPEALYPSLMIVWSCLFGFLIPSGLNVRSSSRFDLSLPLSARRLWFAHVLAILASGAAVLATAAGIITIGNLLVETSPLLQPGLVSLTIHLGVGMMLTVAIVQSPKPKLFEIPFTASYVVLLIFSLVLFFGVVVVLSALPPVAAVVPLTVSLILGFRVYVKLPASFSTAPVEVRFRADFSHDKRPNVGAVEGTLPSRLASSWLVASTIVRSSQGNFTWFYPAAATMYGFLLSRSSYDLRFPFLFLTLLVLAGWTMVSLRGIHRLDPLPLPRGRVFATLVTPCLLAFALGYAVGVGAQLLGRPLLPVVGFDECCDRYEVRVPSEYYEISLGQKPLNTDAPWGENHPISGWSLLQGGAIRVFNPFTTPANSSHEFVALQLERAVRAVTGETITSDEIRGRYLEILSDGRIRPTDGRFSLHDDYPGLRNRNAGRTFPVILALIAVPWLMFNALVYRLSRAVAAPGFGWLVGVVTFGPMIVIGIGSFVAAAVGLLDLAALSVAFNILVRKFVDLLPGGTAAVWCFCALLISGAYVPAMLQFARVEAPPPIGVQR